MWRDIPHIRHSIIANYFTRKFFFKRQISLNALNQYMLLTMRKTCLIKTGKVEKKAEFCLHKICLVAIAIVLSATEMTMSATSTGFGQAITTIQSYQSEVKSLMNAIAAVICLVGAFNVYFKMQNGDQDVKKTIMLTIGGCIAFVALGQMLPEFFK